jgi:hypothetical protein
MLAAAFWFGIAADHKFLLWRQLYLDPAAGSAAGFVKRIGFFRSDPDYIETPDVEKRLLAAGRSRGVEVRLVQPGRTL